MPLVSKRISKAPDVRKAEIVEAAAGLFKDNGFTATSVEQIVKKVGVSHGTFFYHFPTKQDVLVALGTSRLKAFQATLRGWLDDPKMTPGAKFFAALSKVNSLRNMRMAVDFIGFGFIRQDPEVHNTLVNLAVPMLLDDVEALLRQGIDSGEFRVADPRATALCVLLLSADLIHRADVTEKVVKWPALYDAFRAGMMAMLGATAYSGARGK